MTRFFALCVALVLLSSPVAAEIFPSADEVRPTLPGQMAPAFLVRDLQDREVRFDPERLNAPVVLTFYRGGWCPYCNMHLNELRATEETLRELGFEVWFVSPDRPELLAEGDHADNDYRLLSDASAEAAQAFGIAFRLDDETHRQYQRMGVDLNERSAESHRALPAPATFIIGRDGVVQFSYVNPDYRVRLAPEVLMAAARAYVEGEHDRLERRRSRD